MLKCFTHFFVQDEDSKLLLQTIEINNAITGGDTRFDRVISIAENFQPIEAIGKFCDDVQVLVAGSTWPTDEKIVKEITNSFPDLKLIIAPHEIHKEHLQQLKLHFPDSYFFSQFTAHNSQLITHNCLIIDNIGMLSRLYSYATIVYIGGGFDQGIHNVLEAAVYGKPVIFGPHFEKFREAINLKKTGAAFSINNQEELRNKISSLLQDKKMYADSCESARAYVYKNRGATEKIMRYIQENRLLIN
jgi:3-deoxy-D-manno-octulosonic-acid transferase